LLQVEVVVVAQTLVTLALAEVVQVVSAPHLDSLLLLVRLMQLL
jgi:hypothetical protein